MKDDQIKCPKCGETTQVEVESRIRGLFTSAVKIKIYCNTCGQISIITDPADGA